MIIFLFGNSLMFHVEEFFLFVIAIIKEARCARQKNVNQYNIQFNHLESTAGWTFKVIQ
jgi:hypothetical protein